MFSLPFLCVQLLKNLKSLEFIIAHPTPKFPSYYITLIWTMETISILISLCLVFSQLESVNSRPPVSSLKKKKNAHINLTCTLKHCSGTHHIYSPTTIGVM